MCVLSDNVGDVGRPLSRGKGGGVSERARGLLWFDGEGEMAGDEGSSAGLMGMTLIPFSSSEFPLGSSSLRSADTKAGPGPPFGSSGRGAAVPLTGLTAAVVAVAAAAAAVGAAVVVAAPFEDGPAVAGDDAEVDASAWVGSLRVRGRLSFRSGSWAGSMGDAVVDRIFRFRAVALGDASESRAASRAPQALLSSRVSTTGGGVGTAGGALCKCSLI